MNNIDIDRINELYHKSKSVGLTKAEEAEQKKLRKAYLAAIRKNLRGSLNRIDIQNKDGSIENLGEKYGKNRILWNNLRNCRLYCRNLLMRSS